MSRIGQSYRPVALGLPNALSSALQHLSALEPSPHRQGRPKFPSKDALPTDFLFRKKIRKLSQDTWFLDVCSQSLSPSLISGSAAHSPPP